MPIKSLIRETISMQGFHIELVANFLSLLALKSSQTIVLTLVIGNLAIIEGIGIQERKAI